MAAEINLNKDILCPNCGSKEFTEIGPPAKVIKDGVEIMAVVRYSKVIECKQCRHIRGKQCSAKSRQPAVCSHTGGTAEDTEESEPHNKTKASETGLN